MGIYTRLSTRLDECGRLDTSVLSDHTDRTGVWCSGLGVWIHIPRSHHGNTGYRSIDVTRTDHSICTVPNCALCTVAVRYKEIE